MFASSQWEIKDITFSKKVNGEIKEKKADFVASCYEGDCYITFVRRPANKVGCHAFARRSCLFASPFVWMELLFYDCNDALQ